MSRKREHRWELKSYPAGRLWCRVTKMAEADGWVMVRYFQAVPFTITVKQWNALATERPDDGIGAHP